MEFFQLGKDKYNNISSQPIIKSGSNKGKRFPEKEGTWVYVAGYCYEARWDAKDAHAQWLKALSKLRYTFGKYELDGVVNFYIYYKTKEPDI